MDQTRFTPDLELDRLSPDEAFAALGNEIRLDIIRVLWRAGAAYEYDDGSDAVETVSYSELQTEIDIDDNGKFNYHLSKLAEHGLLNHLGNGVYVITEDGQRYLDGELDAEEIDDNSGENGEATA